jgi:hypothetical protein
VKKKELIAQLQELKIKHNPKSTMTIAQKRGLFLGK